MTAKYYVNDQGKYIGCSDDPSPPIDGIEVPSYPSDAIEGVWNGHDWVYIKNMVVSRRQARRALLDAGLLEQVDIAIESISDSKKKSEMLIDWQDATEFRRDNSTLIYLAGALGLTDAALDQLFVQASQF